MLNQFFQGIFLALCLLWGMEVEATDVPSIPVEEIVEKLRQGGNILYFRHSTTDHTKDDQHPVDLDDCETQRNLSSQGLQQAMMIGNEIRRLAIPIGDVQSSPYCRCTEMAHLAFGRYRINEDLYFAVVAGPAERKRIIDVLRAELVKPPADGMNNVIIAHTANLREATGIWPKPEGVAWIFKPDGKGGTKVLGEIEPTDWLTVKSPFTP